MICDECLLLGITATMEPVEVQEDYPDDSGSGHGQYNGIEWECPDGHRAPYEKEIFSEDDDS